MISVPRRTIRPNPVLSDSLNLGQTRNRLHVARSRANILGLGGEDKDVNWANYIAIHDMTPQMINRAHNALKANPFFMDVYLKLRAGRRCSCWGKGETPDGYCVSCFKAGYVGGYEKFGCQTELIDSTHPDLSLINVLPDSKCGRVPVPLTLTSKAVFGVVELKVKLFPNSGLLDLFRVYATTPKGSGVKVLVKRVDEDNFVPATDESITSRLGAGVLLVRIELSRKTLSTTAPYLKAIRLRYQVRGKERSEVRVPMNIPMGEDAFQLQDLGIWETFTTLQLFTDNTLKAIKSEDFIHNPRDNRRFMIYNAKKFDPTNTTVSWLLTARFVQSELDAVNEFPL